VKLDLARGCELARRFNLSTTEPLLFEGDLARVEHLVHEVTHGISLNLPIERGVDLVVSDTLLESDDSGLEEEALILATESVLFKWLGIEIDQADLDDAAQIQGVEVIELHQKQKSHAATDLAHRVLSWLRTHGVVT
jgi:hypothetical protein